MRLVGIDPGLTTGGIVAIDVGPDGLASLVSSASLGSKAECRAEACHSVMFQVVGFLVNHAPDWLAIEANVMMGAAGRANGDVPLLGRGAILAGIGMVNAGRLANPIGWLSANPSKWRKALGGHGKALAGEKGKPKRLCPKRLAYLSEHLKGAERLQGDHEQDAAFLALWLAQQVAAAQAGLDSVLEVQG